MKKLLLFTSAVLLFFLPGCKKESTASTLPNKAHVIVQIDYLGSNGYYNDDIDAVPSGLTLGSNGPYDVDVASSYTIDYKPSSNWTAPIHLSGVTFTAGATWVIHCYVQGNVGYVKTELK